MVFNATFNNISFISCRSVLLVEETGVPGESHRHISSGSFEIEKSISFTHNSNGVILPSLHYKFLDKECWLGETNTTNLDLCDLIPC